VARVNVSRTIQSYLQVLTAQSSHYATLRLFDGLELVVRGRLCLDAQVPVLIAPDSSCECGLTLLASYRKGDVYRQEILYFESHYDPGEVMSLGPSRWPQLADMLAYQLVGEVVQWKKDKDAILFGYLAITTGLKPNRQRFYLYGPQGKRTIFLCLALTS
jgi:hypothetical protein